MRLLNKIVEYSMVAMACACGLANAEDVKFVLFFQSDIDATYRQLMDAQFETAIQNLSPIHDKYSIRTTYQPYTLEALQNCVRSSYALSSTFPAGTITSKDQILSALESLTAHKKLVGLKTTDQNHAKALDNYLNVRAFYDAELTDALVICFRAQGVLKTKSNSYPIFGIILPAKTKLMRVGANASTKALLSQPINSPKQFLDVLTKTAGVPSKYLLQGGHTLMYLDRGKDSYSAKELTGKAKFLVINPNTSLSPSRDSMAETVTHEMGHYLGLTHANTEFARLPELGAQAATAKTINIDAVCKSFVKFTSNPKGWYVADQDYAFSGVTDTATHLDDDNFANPDTDGADTFKKVERCYQIQKSTIEAQGMSAASLMNPLLNRMSYGAPFAIVGDWTPSQKSIAQTRMAEILREAAGTASAE